MRKRVFISVANAEHGQLRTALRNVLKRTGFDVEVQPDFPHSVADTIRKLDELIAPCDLLVHIVGQKPGTVAEAPSVADFFAHTPRDQFLQRFPRASKSLGNCACLTYFQWEPWLALNRVIPVLVYGAENHADPEFPQRAHLDSLHQARCQADALWSAGRDCGQIVADVCRHFGITPVEDSQHLAPLRFLHHGAELFLGRDRELAFLDSAWNGGLNVVSVVGWGGVGKTALLSEWIQTRFIDRRWRDDEGEPNPQAYFDWSFYDQGTRAVAEGVAARTGSVGDFFERALTFFGDRDPSSPGKGQRLAELVRKQRALVILDGLEPLQYPIGSPMAGRLLDPDLRDLVASLAQQNPGLCVLTSRQAVKDIDTLHGLAAGRRDLEDLPKDVAVRLLRKLQVSGSDEELEAACERFDCHALSLTLLGRFLMDAHGGDIRRIDRVKLDKADRLTRENRNRTAWNVLVAYDQWLGTAQDGGNPTTLAVLRLTGLFDRPASPECLAALRAYPPIAGLTEHIVAMDSDEWTILLRRLDKAHLVKLRASPDDPTRLGLDAHPLVREYFAKQLREQAPDAWREAHSRLFDHLCKTTEPRPDTLEGLQPLYQAVTHGCLAGRQQEAFHEVYIDRILRGTGDGGCYSTRQLGAIGANLGAVAAFFEEPWSRVSANLSSADQSWLLNEAAFSLRALGRLTEAAEPMRVGGEMDVASGDWRNAATSHSNLSELEVTLGDLGKAVADGNRSVEHADQSGNAFQKMINRTTAADALHQSGERQRAQALFAEAEQLQAERQPAYPLLYSLRGFQYVDLLLVPAERLAWRVALGPCGAGTENGEATLGNKAGVLATGPTADEATDACDEAGRRAMKLFEWRIPQDSLLDIALDHLSLARAGLYRALVADTPTDSATVESVCASVATALDKLRQANQIQELPKALLTAALCAGGLAGQEDEAERHLAEAQLIAERGPMLLYLADVHLHRARLFRDLDALKEARRLIEKHGYGRRKEELSDAEAALLETPIS
jgi:tetratricopeptide (TPR) repeat protein